MLAFSIVLEFYWGGGCFSSLLLLIPHSLFSEKATQGTLNSCVLSFNSLSSIFFPCWQLAERTIKAVLKYVTEVYRVTIFPRLFILSFKTEFLKHLYNVICSRYYKCGVQRLLFDQYKWFGVKRLVLNPITEGCWLSLKLVEMSSVVTMEDSPSSSLNSHQNLQQTAPFI